MVALSGTSLLQRMAGLDRADMPPEAARFMLTLGFSEAEEKRLAELSEKASLGTLTDAEGQEIDLYLLVGDLVTILHSKARIALRDAPAAR